MLIVLGAVVAVSSAAGIWFAAAIVHSGTGGSGHAVTAFVHPDQRPAAEAGAAGFPLLRRYRVSWHAPDGSLREADLPLRSGSPAAATTRIWVDGRGDRVAAPDDPAHALVVAIAFAAGWEASTLILLAGLYRSVRGLLDAGRHRTWARQWARLDDARNSS